MRHPLATLVLLALLAGTACGERAPVGPDPDPGGPGPAVVGRDSILAAVVATITAERIAAHVNVLAADSLEGRGTPGRGLELAAAYLAAALRDAGLEPTSGGVYEHRYEFAYTLLDTSAVVVEVERGGGPVPEYGRDYLLMGSRTAEATGPILWAGSVEDAPDAGGIDMRGRVVLYDLTASRLDEASAVAVRDADRATQRGEAVAVGFIVPDDFTEAAMRRGAEMTRTWSRALPTFWIRETAAEALLAPAGVYVADLRAGAPRVVEAALHIAGPLLTETASPPNVVALLQGSDPTLGSTYVVVSAHFDHLGIGPQDASGDSIFNGADDNASGTAAVLEVARALASLETPPARSVLFLLVSGEEEGLVGSSRFASSPPVPLSNLVANVNLDMIGRNPPGTVGAVGADYSTLGRVALAMGEDLDGVELDVVPDPWPGQQLFRRSDQLEFACRSVASLLFTSGLHADYHRPSDEVDRLDMDKAARVARLVVHLVDRVANAEDPPTWTEAGLSAVATWGPCPSERAP